MCFFACGVLSIVAAMIPYRELQHLSVAARYTVGAFLSNTQHWHETVYTSCDVLEAKLGA